MVIFVPTDEDSPEILELAAYAKYIDMRDGKATAYVCTNYQCKSPTTDPKEMIRLILNNETSSPGPRDK